VVKFSIEYSSDNQSRTLVFPVFW